jgi:type II secretion system protein C
MGKERFQASLRLRLERWRARATFGIALALLALALLLASHRERASADRHELAFQRAAESVSSGPSRKHGARSLRAATQASISPTPRRLVLSATFPGRNVAEGQAALGTDGEAPLLYSAGALLSNGARLTAIYPDHVTLEKNGRAVSLAPGDRSDAAKAADLLVVGGPATGVVIAPSREALTGTIRPSPVYQGSSLQGYEVYPGQRDAAFAELGLKPGDLITAIDGVALDEPAQAVELMHRLTNGAAVTATIRRGGNVTQIGLNGLLLTAHD